MSKSSKHQKARSRKKAVKKTKRAIGRNKRTNKAFKREASQWPLSRCWINEDWRNPKSLVQAVVLRQELHGKQVAGATFLVDLACLGIKNASMFLFPDFEEFRTHYLSTMQRHQTMVTCEFDLVAKVVETAVAYSGELGFRPHKDFKDASLMLQGAQPEQCSEVVPVGGEDGRPYFFAGLNDNIDRILATLNRTVGEGNYGYFTPLGDIDDDWLD